MFSEQFQGISAAPVARWRGELSSQDAAVIEHMAGTPMEQFQYTREVSGPVALFARGRALVWPLRRRLSRLLRPAPILDHADDRSDE
jgi:hypothetical protein